ncbi:hypothetical protein [Stieleria varia]|uniref:Uncharacterized protein n=1 Tax=Stieleria varia TaxID=2528005 RepID=A0A5C6AH21_9BACT|nr:hypothetical protein [Stieleria varia]TWT98361.1 hypothetical protein Pla52n_48730 [Stieleria varia]
MNAEDLQSIYDELRGSRSAPLVMDARSLFLDQQYTAALGKMTEAQEKYQESRFRILKQDPVKQVDPKAKDADRQIRRLVRKREKAEEILAMIDEVLPELKKLSDKEKTKKAKEAAQAESAPPTDDASSDVADSESATNDESPSESGLDADTLTADEVSPDFVDQFMQSTTQEQIELIGQRFGFQPIQTDQDVVAGTVCFLKGDDESLLVCLSKVDGREPVEMVNLATGGTFHVPLNVLVEFGQERKVVVLLRSPAEVRQLSDDEGATDEVRDRVLDMGALSQLMDSAQRCGIVPGADQIAYVRDKEFRTGQYDLALQIIESLNGKFVANASARSQRLMREDADIASGRVKMSPKELHAKRLRDRTQDQAIERARSRFNRVLDGLRVLLKQGV